MVASPKKGKSSGIEGICYKFSSCNGGWELIKKHLRGLSISYSRIEGVYGKELPMPLQNYNERKYRILHGKTTNTGELGCYFSHLKALKDFLNSSDSHALILEDDIEPPSNIMNLIDRALSYCKYWNILRLTSFTPGEHLAFAEIGNGYNLSYNLKVLKNTGAYVTDRWAAECVLQKMQPMFLPYDVALDREWHYGFKTACISPLPIRLNMDLQGKSRRKKDPVLSDYNLSSVSFTYSY